MGIRLLYLRKLDTKDKEYINEVSHLNSSRIIRTKQRYTNNCPLACIKNMATEAYNERIIPERTKQITTTCKVRG
jgi:hypothetical protein